MKIAVIGANGFVGSHLVPFLKKKGYGVFPIGHNLQMPKVDIVINLAGVNVFGKRWDEAYKKEILDSRLRVCTALKQSPPKLLLNASAIAPEGTYLSSVARKWEQAALAVGAERTVLMRFGMVLDPSGGALAKMAMATNLYLGAKLGDGEQLVPWIAMDDLLRAVFFCIENEKMEGAVHFVAPHLVPQKRLITDLGHALNKPVFLAIPKMVTRWLVGQAADELLLCSSVATPEKLTRAGFTFDLPNIDAAFNHYFHPPSKSA